MTTPTCACGKPIDAGWTDGEAHDQCAACEVAMTLDGVNLRPKQHRLTVRCCCCGREGPHGAHGLIATCYAKWLRLRPTMSVKIGRSVSPKTRAIYAAIQAGADVQSVVREFGVNRSRFYQIKNHYAGVIK